MGIHSFIYTPRLTIVLILAALTLMFVACGGGKPVIKLYDGQWESLGVVNAIFQLVAEEGYGYRVDTVVNNTIGMQSTLQVGEMDLNLEGWQQNIPDWYQKQTSNGNIVNLGMTYEGGPQFFIIPKWVSEQFDIKSVEEMKDHWELFIDPQDPTKGVFYNCPIGFECHEINKIKLEAYGLDRYYNLVSPSSNDALGAVLGRLQENRQAVLGYHWAPTALMSSYEWQILEEPSHTEECSDRLTAATEDPSLRPVNEACAFENLPIDKLAHKGFLSKAPDLTDMLRKMNVGLEPLNKTLAWAMNNNIDDRRAVAVHYLRTYEDRWAGWVTPTAYEKIKDALNAGEAPQS